MKRIWPVLALALVIGVSWACPSKVLSPLVVVDSAGQLATGFNILVNTDLGRTDWLTVGPDGFQTAYPSGQQFGFVAGVLAGATAPGSRPGKDLSGYNKLQIQLRGLAGGESVDIGIKDADDPDNGTETKKTVVLTSTWETKTFTLSDFATADLNRIYIVFEVVFTGAASRTVFFRDVKYVQ